MILSCFLVAFLVSHHGCLAQTEGDIGYDYSEAYDDDEDDSALAREPMFDVPILNVTVIQGQNAVLPCGITDLGNNKVTWLDQGAIPLTFGEHRTVDDTRFNVERPYKDFWNLQIREVMLSDQGQYRCTINTTPARSKIVMLHIKVPAQIIDELSSDDTTVQEGDTVVLVCNVTGVPRPTVTWYRRPVNSDTREKIGNEGEIIIIQNVTRYCDDYYECLADNGVSNAVSRQMRVTVEFKPEIYLRNSRMGQALGMNTILDCTITAFPHANNYWLKDGEPINTRNNAKFNVQIYNEGDHTLSLSIQTNSLDKSDYGRYTCVADNALGADSQSIFLYETPSFLPTPSVVQIYQLASSSVTPHIRHGWEGHTRRPHKGATEKDIHPRHNDVDEDGKAGSMVSRSSSNQWLAIFTVCCFLLTFLAKR